MSPFCSTPFPEQLRDAQRRRSQANDTAIDFGTQTRLSLTQTQRCAAQRTMLEAAAPVIDAHAADMKSGIARIAGGRSEVRRERIRAGEPTHPSPSPPGQRILLARPTFVDLTNNSMRSRAFSLVSADTCLIKKHLFIFSSFPGSRCKCVFCAHCFHCYILEYTTDHRRAGDLGLYLEQLS